MSYFFKHILPWQVIITVIYIFYMFINNDWYKTTMVAIPAVFLIFKIYYDKSKYVFVFVRKIFAWAKNPGVHWSCSYLYYLEKNINFNDISRKYVDELRNSGYHIKNINNSECRLSFTIDDSDINIYYESESMIKIEFGSNISYRESIEIFENQFYTYKRPLENLTANTNEKIYTINLKFKKYNPFYSLYIKNYADIKVNIFVLRYNINNLDIEISDKEMVIRSDDEKSIQKALKNYLIVSE